MNIYLSDITKKLSNISNISGLSQIQKSNSIILHISIIKIIIYKKRYENKDQ